jgi:hypothetical protein
MGTTIEPRTDLPGDDLARDMLVPFLFATFGRVTLGWNVASDEVRDACRLMARLRAAE